MNWLAPPSLSIETSRSRFKRLGKQRRFAGNKNEANKIQGKRRVTLSKILPEKHNR